MSTAPSRPLQTSLQAELWDVITAEAAAESPLWAAALHPNGDRELEPVFSPLTEQRYALGLETIYEGYLLHYGRPRLFVPGDGDTALLLGDYLFAHGLVRIAQLRVVQAVADLADLISLCAQIRAESRTDDGVVWAATASRLGAGGLDRAREALRMDSDPLPLGDLACDAAGRAAVDRALAAHRRRAA
jgi:hypothetical protein